jgi:DNA-directed RNA polymerase alpha subunit
MKLKHITKKRYDPHFNVKSKNRVKPTKIKNMTIATLNALGAKLDSALLEVKKMNNSTLTEVKKMNKRMLAIEKENDTEWI